MKLLRLFSLLLFVFVYPATGDDLLGFRTWTSSDGNEVEAELVSASDQVVTIRRKSDGRDFKLPFERLSKDDQDLIERVKADLLKGVEIWKISDYIERRKFANELHKRSLVTKPSSLELARRLGILEQIASIVNLADGNRYLEFKSETLSFPIDGLVLGGGGGSLGKTGNKTYLFRSGDLFVRLNSIQDMKQKGDSIVSSTGRVIVTVGSSLNVKFPSAYGVLRVTAIDKERVSTKEAVVVTVQYSY